MHARAPASAANLGPGFDTLALALPLFLDAEVTPGPRLQLIATGVGADLPPAGHRGIEVARQVLGHERFTLRLHSEIPIARGLGSSAALAVAVAAAAGAEDPLAVAVSFDGHAENAAASVLGGFVAAAFHHDRPVAAPLPLDPAIRAVVVIPDEPVPTVRARAALPKEVAFADAVFNLGRVAQLIAGMGDHWRLMPAWGEDRLHQPHRAALFPEAEPIIAAMVDAGALLACWSGAGSSLLALVTASSSRRVATAATDALERARVLGQVREMAPAAEGLRTW